MNEPVTLLFFFGFAIFMMGIYMLFAFRNLIRIMLAVEVMAKGITLIFLAAGLYQKNVDFIQALIVGFIIVETILAAVMIAIVVKAHKIYESLDIRLQSKLKG